MRFTVIWYPINQLKEESRYQSPRVLGQRKTPLLEDSHKKLSHVTRSNNCDGFWRSLVMPPSRLKNRTNIASWIKQYLISGF